MNRWVDIEGELTEYRRPRGKLVVKRKHPAQTGYVLDLYANESKATQSSGRLSKCYSFKRSMMEQRMLWHT